MGNMSVVIGIVGTLVGFNILLQNFQNFVENWAPPLSVALITFFMNFCLRHFLFANDSFIR